jgi:hypothetical protein
VGVLALQEQSKRTNAKFSSRIASFCSLPYTRIMQAKFKLFISTATNAEFIELWKLLVLDHPYEMALCSQNHRTLEQTFRDLIQRSKFHPNFFAVCIRHFNLIVSDEDMQKIQNRRRKLHLIDLQL